MSNIVEVVTSEKNLVSVGKGMRAAGLEELLSKGGPYTVFAPTDIAFGKLHTGEWQELLKPENKAKLAGIMNNYVVKGKTAFKDLTHGKKLKTLGEKELAVKVADGHVDIDGARIQGRDLEASNGVIHALDRVLPFK
ncbi:MAG: fasciclin domain-containing protein [Chitinophagaceae bacterium]|nr:fasciclin domain-containing protein [Chitinophagaceae bacterium]